MKLVIFFFCFIQTEKFQIMLMTQKSQKLNAIEKLDV